MKARILYQQRLFDAPVATWRRISRKNLLLTLYELLSEVQVKDALRQMDEGLLVFTPWAVYRRKFTGGGEHG